MLGGRDAFEIIYEEFPISVKAEMSIKIVLGTLKDFMISRNSEKNIIQDDATIDVKAEFLIELAKEIDGDSLYFEKELAEENEALKDAKLKASDIPYATNLLKKIGVNKLSNVFKSEAVVSVLKPLQDEVARLSKEKAYIDNIIKNNGEKADYYAMKTLRKVQRKVGFPDRIRQDFIK